MLHYPVPTVTTLAVLSIPRGTIHAARGVLSSSRIKSMTCRKVALSVLDRPSGERDNFNAIPTTTGVWDDPI
jgi:hypothetical protein